MWISFEYLRTQSQSLRTHGKRAVHLLRLVVSWLLVVELRRHLLSTCSILILRRIDTYLLSHINGCCLSVIDRGSCLLLLLLLEMHRLTLRLGHWLVTQLLLLHSLDLLILLPLLWLLLGRSLLLSIHHHLFEASKTILRFRRPWISRRSGKHIRTL